MRVFQNAEAVTLFVNEIEFDKHYDMPGNYRWLIGN
jgi:hypothetical protein